MTYMRIYWIKDPDSLKKLMMKYVGNDDIWQVGYNGWEIIVNDNEDIVREIKKYIRYRSKKLIIDEIEELYEIEEDEDCGYNFIIPKNNNINIDITGQELFKSWDYLMSKYDDEPDPDIMNFYRYQDTPACYCDYECDCEEQRIQQEIIAQLLIEGRYKSICGYSWRRKELEKMKNYY